jgi:hypothetical protein
MVAALINRIRKEPALVSALLLAIFNLLGLAPETSNSILQIVGVVLPLVLGLLVRRSVTPTTKLQQSTDKKRTPARNVPSGRV